MIKIPYKCPVCEGSGVVSTPKHVSTNNWASPNTNPYQCQSCSGKGVVFCDCSSSDLFEKCSILEIPCQCPVCEGIGCNACESKGFIVCKGR